MDRRSFLKTAAGLFVPAAPALILPKNGWAQQGGMGPGPGTVHSTGGGGESTVLIDAVSVFSSGQSNTGVSIGVGGGDAIDVGSGSNGTSNRCLIVLALFSTANGGTSTVVTMAWDFAGGTGTNQALTLVPGSKTSNGASGGDIEIWYLMAPTIGAKTFNAVWTGSNGCNFQFVSFVNVDQTGGTTSFPTVNVSTASGKTINISTSPTTRKFVGGFNSASNFTTATDNDIGHTNAGTTFAVAAEWADGTNTLVSYGGGGSGCSSAVAIKGV